MDITGLKCVLTGGAMGIGLATARRLVARGVRVDLWDINAEALELAKNELMQAGGKVETHVVDVTDAAGVYAAASESVRVSGPVDILINNAGYVRPGNLLDQPDEVWVKTIDVNLNGLLYAIRAFLPGMYQRNRGHIVNISSAAGMLGVGGLAVYAATKWAVWGLTESMRFEAWSAGKKGVRWSSIHPSYLAEGMFSGAKLNPLGNLIIPLVKSHDVIAKAIVEGALVRGKHVVKRPVTLNLALRLRALLPDPLFQRMLVLFGVHKSMHSFRGRTP
jgi:NADP-dependent 3-hydroxy acid dehydrogenase YdfG